MIVFIADVKLNQDANLDIEPRGRRFSPNLQFSLPQLRAKRFGLAFMQPARRLRSGEEGMARFEMLGVEEFRELSLLIAPGVKFVISQGPIILGSGTISQVDERTIDASP